MKSNSRGSFVVQGVVRGLGERGRLGAASLLVACVVASLGGALVACSSDTPAGPATTNDAGAATDSGGSSDASKPDTATVADTGATPLNGCSTYVDHTADADPRAIAWTFAIATSPDRCIKIKVGQKVKWDGDLSVHPVGAKGGDANNPVASIDPAGETIFPAAGTFGYECKVHPAMTGAISVVP